MPTGAKALAGCIVLIVVLALGAVLLGGFLGLIVAAFQHVVG